MIVDRERARVLAVSGSRVEIVATQVDRGPRSSDFGGWYGLQAHRTQRRIIELGRHHYRDTPRSWQGPPPAGRCRW